MLVIVDMFIQILQTTDIMTVFGKKKYCDMNYMSFALLN